MEITLTFCKGARSDFVRPGCSIAESRHLESPPQTTHGIQKARHMLTIRVTIARYLTAFTTTAPFTQEALLTQPASSRTTSRISPSTGPGGCIMPRKRKLLGFAILMISFLQYFSYSSITLAFSTSTLTCTTAMASSKPFGPQIVS